ncbi:MAG: porphobilinogen synthase [Legionellaceae bacterium]|nr:porphobilinogen synthase [Legionellaceae bacterium]
MIHRLSRMRASPQIRALIQETRLHPSQFIAPLFIRADITEKKAITSMPGLYQWTLDSLPEAIQEIQLLKIPAVLLFGIPESKDAHGACSCHAEGIVQQAIRVIRKTAPELCIIADVCLCEYTDHGHCGVLKDDKIDIEATLEVLNTQSISLAQAGCDFVAPSGMIDGMIHSIRHALDHAQLQHCGIISYSAKYRSHLYGPFREAAMGAPQFGDRSTYQMDFNNHQEAIRETAIDIQEGADMMIVKPALWYLDVIHALKQRFPEVPLCAYQVSGEYSMIHHAANAGVFSLEAAMLESLTAIKRAGADILISYFAQPFARWYWKINGV